MIRLDILKSGQDRPAKFTLKAMRTVTRADAPEILHVVFYRHRYFGTPFYAMVQDLLRGPSFWTVGERERFAAHTSELNQCPFCTSAHNAFSKAYTDESAPVRTEAHAVLAFLDKMAHAPDTLTADDAAAARAAGVDDAALDDAVRISALFHVINRVMDAVGAEALEGRRLAVSTKVIRRMGYRLPPTVRYLSRGS